MTDTVSPRPRRRWISLIVLLAVLAVLILAATESSAVYVAHRHAQNASDSAVLAGMRQLLYLLDQHGRTENDIAADMLRYATLNGLEHGDDLVAYYVDEAGVPLAPVGAGIPPDVRGIEATATLRARTFLTRALGLDGWPLTHRSVIICELEYLEGEDTPTLVCFRGSLPP